MNSKKTFTFVLSAVLLMMLLSLILPNRFDVLIRKKNVREFEAIRLVLVDEPSGSTLTPSVSEDLSSQMRDSIAKFLSRVREKEILYPGTRLFVVGVNRKTREELIFGIIFDYKQRFLAFDVSRTAYTNRLPGGTRRVFVTYDKEIFSTVSDEIQRLLDTPHFKSEMKQP